jgi:hypothetical protein
MQETTTEPAIDPFNVKDWLYFGIAVIVIFFEYYYMWTWCKWFTNCY